MDADSWSYELLPLNATFRAFLNEHCSEWTYNTKRLQSHLYNVCAPYCVAYLLHRCNGIPMTPFTKMFGTDLVDNRVRLA